MPATAVFAMRIGPDYNWYWSNRTGGDDVRVDVYWIGSKWGQSDNYIQVVQNLYNNYGFRWLNYDFRFEFDTGGNQQSVWINTGMTGYSGKYGSYEYDILMQVSDEYYNGEDGTTINRAARRLLYESSGNWEYFYCGAFTDIQLPYSFGRVRGARLTYCNVWISKE